MNRLSSFIDEILKEIRCHEEIKKDLREELMGHLEMLVEELVEAGYPIKEAEQLAISQFGSSQFIGNELHQSIISYDPRETRMIPRKLITGLLTTSVMTLFLTFFFTFPLTIDTIWYSLALSPLFILPLFAVIFLYGIPISILIESLVKRYKPKKYHLVTFLLYTASAIIIFLFDALLIQKQSEYSIFIWDILIFCLIASYFFMLIDGWLQTNAYEKYWKYLVLSSISIPILLLFGDLCIESLIEVQLE